MGLSLALLHGYVCDLSQYSKVYHKALVEHFNKNAFFLGELQQMEYLALGIAGPFVRIMS